MLTRMTSPGRLRHKAPLATGDPCRVNDRATFGVLPAHIYGAGCAMRGERNVPRAVHVSERRARFRLLR